MNKSELIAIVAEKTGCTKVAAKETVNVVFDALAEAMSNGDKIAIDKFGTFTRRERAAREGVNPKTKEKIQIPAKQTVKFKASSAIELK